MKGLILHDLIDGLKNVRRNWFSLLVISTILVSSHSLLSSGTSVNAAAARPTITGPVTVTTTVTVTVTVTFGTWIWSYTPYGPGTAIVTAPTLTYVLMAADGIRDLISYVKAMGLKHGIENSLTSKLENAIKSIEKGQNTAAVGMLRAFMNQVEALKGKKMAVEQANYLVEQAQAIMDMLRS